MLKNQPMNWALEFLGGCGWDHLWCKQGERSTHFMGKDRNWRPPSHSWLTWIGPIHKDHHGHGKKSLGGQGKKSLGGQESSNILLHEDFNVPQHGSWILEGLEGPALRNGMIPRLLCRSQGLIHGHSIHAYPEIALHSRSNCLMKFHDNSPLMAKKKAKINYQITTPMSMDWSKGIIYKKTRFFHQIIHWFLANVTLNQPNDNVYPKPCVKLFGILQLKRLPTNVDTRSCWALAWKDSALNGRSGR